MSDDLNRLAERAGIERSYRLPHGAGRHRGRCAAARHARGAGHPRRRRSGRRREPGRRVGRATPGRCRRRKASPATCPTGCATAAAGASPARSTACARRATGAWAISRISPASPRSPPAPAPISSASIRCTPCSWPMRRKFSPFSPSSRHFLNPLYIAARQGAGRRHGARRDRRPGGGARRRVRRLRRRRPAQAEGADLPLPRLPRDRRSGRRAANSPITSPTAAGRSTCTLCSRRCRRRWSSEGHGATWHGWPEEYRHPASRAVTAFAAAHAEAIAFHSWLQWTAERQLADGPGPRQGRRHAHRPLSRHGGRRRPRRLGHLVGPRTHRAVGAHRRAARLLQRRRSGLGRGAAVAGGAPGARLSSPIARSSTRCCAMPARCASTTP